MWHSNKLQLVIMNNRVKQPITLFLLAWTIAHLHTLNQLSVISVKIDSAVKQSSKSRLFLVWHWWRVSGDDIRFCRRLTITCRSMNSFWRCTSHSNTSHVTILSSVCQWLSACWRLLIWYLHIWTKFPFSALSRLSDWKASSLQKDCTSDPKGSVVEDLWGPGLTSNNRQKNRQLSKSSLVKDRCPEHL